MCKQLEYTRIRESQILLWNFVRIIWNCCFSHGAIQTDKKKSISYRLTKETFRMFCSLLLFGDAEISLSLRFPLDEFGISLGEIYSWKQLEFVFCRIVYSELICIWIIWLQLFPQISNVTLRLLLFFSYSNLPICLWSQSMNVPMSHLFNE